MRKMPIHRGVKALLIVFLMTAASSLFADTASRYPVTLGTELQGLASWYGGKFHGRLTSSGEIFNTNDMTAAHKTLPFGTIVKVTNQDNGKSALVKINDRGPFVEGRIIDLSRAAAEQLDMIGQGVARVSLDIVDFVTDSDLFAVQVGAYTLEKNAEKARATLEAAGFVVTVERNTLGVARVSARAIAGRDLPDSRKKLEGLGFSGYLVKKEKTETPRLSRNTGAGSPTALVTSP